MRAACSSEPAGIEVGDLAPDFALTDQRGDEVRLADYCGMVVTIEWGAMWCSACQTYAEDLAALHATYGEQGFIPLVLMAENLDSLPPSPSDLLGFAIEHGLMSPVLADAGWTTYHHWWPELHIPQVALIAKDGRILKSSYAQAEDIRAALAE